MAIITISRGSYAGGRALAHRLAERLEYPSLSRERVLQEASEKFGISEDELTSSLNKSPRYWEQNPGKRLAYVKCVTAVLLKNADGGNLVYHGHVAHLLLTDVPKVLRVRVVAPTEYRVVAAMEHLNLDRDQAMAHIKRVDHDRKYWARFLYGVDWEDPRQYDIILNLGTITDDSACETVVRLTEQPDFAPDAESLKGLADAALASRVWATLARNPDTRSAAIDVAADSGKVVISGSMSSAKGRDAVESLAKDVEGVKSLTVELGTGANWYW